jgi:hypothetical protein
MGTLEPPLKLQQFGVMSLGHFTPFDKKARCLGEVTNMCMFRNTVRANQVFASEGEHTPDAPSREKQSGQRLGPRRSRGRARQVQNAGSYKH